jgi:arylsulfatase A-like enzyme
VSDPVQTYRDGAPFPGVIGRTAADSMAAWPMPPIAPPGAPNVVIIVLDDVGFAQLGCYGSDIPTPNIDRLAAEGLRFRNFHTTAMCSPTRAALLTGRNPHTTGMGGITEVSMGYPGYNARITKRTAFLSEVLRDSGWCTWALGKWHLAPPEELDAASSRARWPLGRGFERFYGFLGPETNQWEPDLVVDNTPTDPPRFAGYHLTEDLVDRGIELVHDLRNASLTKPFFAYLAFGACHSPFHVPREWRERFRGLFDAGWDAWREATHRRQMDMGVMPRNTQLTPRPPWVQDWSAMSEAERLVAARSMELFAGFLAHTDHHIGRYIDELRAMGELDNTIVMLLSDNGASAEGGRHGSVNANLFYNQMAPGIDLQLAALDALGDPTTNPHYPMGWALAGNTPFQRWKRETHEGGTTDPLIVRWPARIPAASNGAVRSQYTHAIDVMPTILDVLGIGMPAVVDGVEQAPLAGASFADALADANAAEHRTTQYYEQFGCRAIYRDGWKAVAFHPLGGLANYSGADPFRPFDADPWELYQVAVDPSETNDLAGREPDRLQSMIELWWTEAERFGALPLHSLRNPFMVRPGSPEPRSRYVYRAGSFPVPRQAAVNVLNRAHAISAHVIVSAGDRGVLMADGGRFGGYALYVDGGRLHYVNTTSTMVTTVVSSTVDIPVDRAVSVGVRATPCADGLEITLAIDGAVAGLGVTPPLPPLGFALAGDGLSIGFDAGSPVGSYESPFIFTGMLDHVVVDVSGEPQVDAAAELENALRHQ